MYNKIFTKILDSSIWLEPDATRIVWVTCIAAMDEDGFCQFASPANLAHRANVTLEACTAALACLEGEDVNSSDPDQRGRRLERVPGGWMVLNAAKYRELVTRVARQAQTRERVRRHRLKRTRNAVKRNANVFVTPSEAYTYSGSEAGSDTEKIERETRARAIVEPEIAERAGRLVERYSELYREHRHGARHRERPVLDWQDACGLCRTWSDDARLEKLAILVLTTDDDWITKSDRSFKIFALKASWADDRLVQWEQKRARA